MRNLHFLTGYCRKAGTPIRLGFCPMRINWRELPDVVQFCNQRDMELILNNVLHPAEATLRTLSHRDLAEIVDYLEGRGGKAASRISRMNLERYHSLINELVAWRDDAATRGQGGAEPQVAARLHQLALANGRDPQPPVRAAMMDWVSKLLDTRGDGSGPVPSLSQNLRSALERDGAESFLEQYFQALGDVGPLLHVDVPGILAPRERSGRSSRATSAVTGTWNS